jgi:hypothetical protein
MYTRTCKHCETEMNAVVAQPFGPCGDLQTMWWVCPQCKSKSVVDMGSREDFTHWAQLLINSYASDSVDR